MVRSWTFRRTIAAGFVAMVLMTALVAVIALVALNQVSGAKDQVIRVDSQLQVDAEHMEATANLKTLDARGYLLSGRTGQLGSMTAARTDFLTTLAAAKRLNHTAEGAQWLQAIQAAEDDHQHAVNQVNAMRAAGQPIDQVAAASTNLVNPKFTVLSTDLQAFSTYQQHVTDTAREAASTRTAVFIVALVALVIATLVVACMIGLALTRRLRKMIATTVGEVQTSSAELQATANQQATGARQQATAMSEITTTINELLVTSRQIASSAQRVAQVAGQTAGAGQAGEATVSGAQESMAGIRRQVDLIVNHMLELGEKSQRIGAVLDIVSELAEQTNILAINSTIEAAGAGEAGKRFAVVADEIRKLADRVADSTKEIRGLIDLVRGAVNTTVMATEIGSKAVDEGTRQFSEVAASFEEIAALVTTTTEAVREIELSTKQQSSAVEQVNVAVTSVAQATKEAEASSGQTLQTATQLSDLSRELHRLVEIRAAA